MGTFLPIYLRKCLVVDFSCDIQDLPFYLKMDFSLAEAVHDPSRHSVILPKNIQSDNQKGLDLFD